MNTVSKKKTLLSCLLAVCMGLSALAGGLLIKADAESVNTTSLVTTSGATVTANEQYTLNSGTKTGGAGLYIKPETQNTPYQTEINGVFTGSFGMMVRFPGEGFWWQNVNTTAEIIVSVASIAVPDAKFEIHIGNKCQTFAYVTYDWQGQTLYRSRHSRWNNDYDGGNYLYTETLCGDVNESQYMPVIGDFGSEANATRAGYIGIEAEADGVYNVVMYGIAEEPNRKKVASFSVDPSTFVPVDTGTTQQGADPNLPKIDLSDGYMVSVSVSDPWDVDDVDFIIDSIAESSTGDPYAEGNGTVYTLNTETLQTMPSFYQTWYDSITHTADLVTVTGDAQVEETPRQYVLKNASNDGKPAGTAVGDTGLYVASTEDDSADGYTVALNGVFTGSVGMQIAFPGEGFWDGSYREAVMTVTSVTDPEETFQLHLDDTWGMYAYVTFEYEGQTLTRARSKYYADPFDPVTGADGADWLYYKDTDSYYFPAMGVFQDAGTAADPRRETSYFGLEMTADGALNVILMANRGDWAEPYKRVLASFAEDPETFEPKTEGKGSTPNLPKLESFKDGYTIRFDISDNANNKACDFLLESIAVSETGDAYRSENNGTVYTLNGAGVEEVPAFYTAWLEFPSITVSDHDAYIAAGEDYTAPQATYATNGEPTETAEVTEIQYRVDGGEWTTPTDKVIPGSALTAGAKVEVRYTVGVVSEIITLSVRNMAEEGESFDTTKVVETSQNVTVTPNTTTTSGGVNVSETGMLFRSKSAYYSFDLVGRFTGDTTIRWGTAADEDWAVQDRQVEFIIADATDPDNYFKVAWISNYQSAAWVEYVYNGTKLYCARDQWGGNTFYYTYGAVTDHDKSQYLPTIGQASSSGILGLRWSGDVLNVVALNRDGNEQVLASFENDLEGFEPVTTGTGDKSNLPKISFEYGYTISVNVTTQSRAARSATAAKSMKAAMTAASEPRSLDFMLFEVKTEEDTLTFDKDELEVEPSWNTKGEAMPVFDDIPVLPGVQTDSGNQVTVPALPYTAKKASLSVAWIKPGGSQSPVSVDDVLSMTEKGDHILRYTVEADGVPYVKDVTVHVCDFTMYVSGAASCVAEGIGTFQCEHGKTAEKILPVDPDAHTYWAKWTWDGETPSVEFYCKDCDAEAEFTGEIKVVESEEESVDATCQTEGKKVLEASVVFGGYRYIDLHEAVIPVAPHALTAVAEKPSTCMEEGTKAYYICSTCGKLFLDAEGKTETTLEEIVIPTGGHQLKEVPAKESTCAEEGNKAYWECSICGKLFLDAEGKTETSKEEVSLPTSGQHNMVQVPAKEPTCTEDGNSTYYKCSECGRCTSDDKGEMEIDESSMKLPATGHKFEGGVCTVCGAEDPGDGASEGLTGGQIAAIVVAAVVVAAGVVVAVVLVIRKKKLGGQK